jgi:hypothetical protein
VGAPLTMKCSLGGRGGDGFPQDLKATLGFEPEVV